MAKWKIGIELVILFCHTSALIKLLISEPNSDQMEESSSQSEAILAVIRVHRESDQ